MRTRRFVFSIIGLFIVYGVAIANALFNDTGSSIKEPFVITINTGTTPNQIADAVIRGGIVSPPFRWLFLYWGSFRGYDRHLQKGSVSIPYGASIATIWQALRDTSPDTFRLTFIEGWNLRDIKAYLEKNGVKGDFYAAAGKPLSSDSLEGFLFPDTYEFYKDVDAATVVKKMRDNFDAKLTPELRAEITKQKLTVNEVVTMASILEIEVIGYQNQRMVADLIRRRLANHWPLQMDSTVNYVTGNNRRSATLTELKMDSPYNTYKYAGLPPGPIGNPGLQSIRAVLYPIKNNYWFFLHTPQGEIKYARTFEEHVANKKYLK